MPAAGPTGIHAGRVTPPSPRRATLMGARLIVVTGAVIVAILRAVGRALYQPDDAAAERVSTWSVRRRDARIFYLLLSGLWLAAASALACGQYAPAPPRVIEWATPPPHIGDGSVYVVAPRFGAIVIPLMAVALVLTPVLAGAGRFLMTLSQFINEKILDPIIEAKIAGPRLAAREQEQEKAIYDRIVAEVTAEVAAAVRDKMRDEVAAAVRDEVRGEVTQQWAGWVSRRDAALAQGLDFNEPKPDEVE